MHEYHSQHRILTIYSYTSFAVFLAKHVGKPSSGTFYVVFRDPGQILIIRDCPGDSGTVGAYAHLAKDTSALEKVQKFGLRICSRNWNASYQELLDTFHLPSLENRRLYLSLSTFFKIIHNLIYFPSSFHPSPVSSSLRCNHAHQYCIPLHTQIT